MAWATGRNMINLPRTSLDGHGRKVLVTGGGGFVGAMVVPHLVRCNFTVTVLDNFSTGRRNAIEGLPVGIIEGDIKDRQCVLQAVVGHDAVIHLAADADIVNSLHDPSANAQTNVIGTINVLDALRQTNPDRLEQVRFVFAASTAPWGGQPPPSYEDKVAIPISPYGAAKLAGEAYCHAYHGAWGMGTVALRFANVYGPNSERKTSVVAKFMSDILREGTITIEGDGRQTRDYIHVADLTDAIVKALMSDVGGEVIQVGTGTETSVLDLVALLRKTVDIPFEVRHRPARPADVRRSYSAISKAKKILGWEPAITLANGLMETWVWFQEYARRQAAPRSAQTQL